MKFYEQIGLFWKENELPEWAFVILLTWTCYLIGWWGVNLALGAIYHWDLFPQYKIQPGKWPAPALVRDAIKKNVISHNITQPLASVALWYLVWEDRVFEPLPSMADFLWQVIVMWFFADFFFYLGHWAFHSPWLYPYHKVHHQWNAPIGVSATHAHILEEMLVNIPSAIGGLFFISNSIHLLSFAFYFLTRLEKTAEDHCGYDFPFSFWSLTRLRSTAKRHDWHHSNCAGTWSERVGNYGVFDFWDILFKTDVWAQYSSKASENENFTNKEKRG